jgi:uncharacterized membrane protein YeaQ/YmgE (transglycosylase-associated protein family)
MLSILIWTIYGIIVGSIAKALVPGEEKMGFLQTVALGVVGSYMGGSIMYLLGQYKAVSPAGIFVGIAGAVIALIVYKKLVSA